MHIDCDFYRSTRAELTQLHDRIVPGAIIRFEEHFSCPGWDMHEFKTFKEFVESTGLQDEYVGLYPKYQQVAVRVTAFRSSRCRLKLAQSGSKAITTSPQAVTSAPAMTLRWTQPWPISPSSRMMKLGVR